MTVSGDEQYYYNLKDNFSGKLMKYKTRCLNTAELLLCISRFKGIFIVHCRRTCWRR